MIKTAGDTAMIVSPDGKSIPESVICTPDDVIENE